MRRGPDVTRVLELGKERTERLVFFDRSNREFRAVVEPCSGCRAPFRLRVSFPSSGAVRKAANKRVPRGRARGRSGGVVAEVGEGEVRLSMDGLVLAILQASPVDGSLALCCPKGVSLLVVRSDSVVQGAGGAP